MDGSERVQIDGWRVNSMMKEADPISQMLKRSPASPQAPHQSLPKALVPLGQVLIDFAARV